LTGVQSDPLSPVPVFGDFQAQYGCFSYVLCVLLGDCSQPIDYGYIVDALFHADRSTDSNAFVADKPSACHDSDRGNDHNTANSRDSRHLNNTYGNVQGTRHNANGLRDNGDRK